MTENWDESGPVVAEIPEIKLFAKWSSDDVQVSDISLTVRFMTYKLTAVSDCYKHLHLKKIDNSVHRY